MMARNGDVFVVGGTESMSNIPLLFQTAAADKFAALNRAKSIFGKLRVGLSFRPGDFTPRIGVLMGLTDSVCGLNMGQTAEVLYRDFGIPREEQSDRGAPGAVAENREGGWHVGRAPGRNRA